MNTITEAGVLEALSQIIDPDLRKDIVTLGFIHNLE
ncbi:MAG: iron-sulfur cluster assembly protein, partial [Sulfuricurvum sp.]